MSELIVRGGRGNTKLIAFTDSNGNTNISASPQLPKPPDNVIISESFSLLPDDYKLFPKCYFCGDKHFRFLFKFNYNNEQVCKKCCNSYNIYNVDRFNMVKEARNNAIKNIKGGNRYE